MAYSNKTKCLAVPYTNAKIVIYNIKKNFHKVQLLNHGVIANSGVDFSENGQKLVSIGNS